MGAGSVWWGRGLSGGGRVCLVGAGSVWWGRGLSGGGGVCLVGAGSVWWGRGLSGGGRVCLVGAGSVWWGRGLSGGRVLSGCVIIIMLALYVLCCMYYCMSVSLYPTCPFCTVLYVLCFMNSAICLCFIPFGPYFVVCSAALSIRLTRLKPRGPPKAGAHATDGGRLHGPLSRGPKLEA